MTRATNEKDVHTRVWATLPWYVTGALSAEETAEVEQHLPECALCRQELAFQSRLAKVVAEHDVSQQQADRAWEVLEAQLESAQMPQSRHVGRLGSPLFGTWTLAALWGGGALAAFFGIALVAWAPTTAPFRTLTTEAPGWEGQVLRIRPMPGAALAEVHSVLDSAGLQVIGAPSETGLITATVPPAADAIDLATRVQSSPLIAFVAVGY